MNDKEFEIFIESHIGLPRQGPGNNDQTKKALDLLKNDIPVNLKILDIGCGAGMQTIELARNLNCKIIAIDIYQQFLDQLNTQAKSENLTHKITTLNQSMFELDFEEESFDIIWSEGSIYLYGFEKGLKDWSKFLKKRGYFAISECSWLVDNVSEKPLKYWNENYPQMKTIKENIEIIKNLGFEVCGHFTLPKEAWEAYFNPLKINLNQINLKYGQQAENVIAEQHFEMDLYQKYSNEYGYEFYVIKKLLK